MGDNACPGGSYGMLEEVVGSVYLVVGRQGRVDPRGAQNVEGQFSLFQETVEQAYPVDKTSAKRLTVRLNSFTQPEGRVPRVLQLKGLILIIF